MPRAGLRPRNNDGDLLNERSKTALRPLSMSINTGLGWACEIGRCDVGEDKELLCVLNETERPALALR